MSAAITALRPISLCRNGSQSSLGKRAGRAATKVVDLFLPMAEVAVLGSGLKSLDRAIQKYELKLVKSADRRYAAH